MKKLYLIFGIFAILLFAGAMCEQAEDASNTNTNTADVDVNSEIIEEIAAGTYSKASIANLTAVADVEGQGTAIRGLLEDGAFEFSAGVELPDPVKENFYEAWLVKDSTEISAGALEKFQNTWVVNFQSDTDYFDYNQVVITRETTANGLDNVAETPLLEGTFSADLGPDAEITICHKPGTPAESTHDVAISSWPGHLAHGDYIGECQEIK